MFTLALNCGSSSIKYALFDAGSMQRFAEGSVERIGESSARFEQRVLSDHAAVGLAPGDSTLDCPGASHAAGLELIFDTLGEDVLRRVAAIGHRVVHGGERFRDATRITPSIIEAIRELEPLAPLHNPINRQGIEVATKRHPDVPQVAVFDTAFHQTLLPTAYRYAIPEPYYRDDGVRRYGFHGTSHKYLTRRSAQVLGRPVESLRLVTLHLGNGASACAISAGKSVDTSMGFTPLEGLVMGTRCGDLDASVPLFLAGRHGLDTASMLVQLTQHSGLFALAGAEDMREVERRRAAGDGGAALAFDLFCYRVKKYVGAYTAALGGLDALVFAGGIGEHSVAVREAVCAGLEALGIALDPLANATAVADQPIHAAGTAVPVLVLHTDEEQEIARQTLETLGLAAAPDDMKA